jgi:hypothetical protein
MAEHGSHSAYAEGHGVFSGPNRSLCNNVGSKAQIVTKFIFYYVAGGWTVTPFIILVADAVLRSNFKKLTVAQLSKNFPSVWSSNFLYRVQQSRPQEHLLSPFMTLLKHTPH